MLPFFRTPERIASLESAARSWLGTPFAAGGGAAKGPRGGATCHELCLQTIADAGYPVPPYRHHNQRPTFASHTARGKSSRTNRETYGETTVQAHTRRMSFPARAYIRRTLEERAGRYRVLIGRVARDALNP
jgi:hypothetical protein